MRLRNEYNRIAALLMFLSMGVCLAGFFGGIRPSFALIVGGILIALASLARHRANRTPLTRS